MNKNWFKTININDVSPDGSIAIKYKTAQIALYNLKNKTEWFATQNLCPHKQLMLLGRGLVGDHDGEPKVVCPMHKNTFSLKTGVNLNGDQCSLITYEVKIEDDFVYINLPENSNEIPGHS